MHARHTITFTDDSFPTLPAPYQRAIIKAARRAQTYAAHARRLLRDKTARNGRCHTKSVCPLDLTLSATEHTKLTAYDTRRQEDTSINRLLSNI